METDPAAAASLDRYVVAGGHFPALYPTPTGWPRCPRPVSGSSGDDLVAVGGQAHPGDAIACRALRIDRRRVDAQYFAAAGDERQVCPFGQHPAQSRPVMSGRPERRGPWWEARRRW